MSFRHKIIVGFLLYLSLTGTESRQKRQTNNPCDSNPCKNGGSCTSNGNNYTCTCTNQFRGRDCESTGKCSAGWEIYGDKCFKFSTSTSGWDASQNSCETDENGYLAEIYSEGENRFLEYIGQQLSSLTSGVWIGLRWHNSWDDFYWVNSSVVYTYDNKLASCNSGYSYKYCIIFDQSNGKWCQQNCTTYSNYICEKAAEDDPCFPNPCQNGGTCSVNGNDYTCTCTNQFRGRDCESTGKCSAGWEIYGDKCFKFSTSTSGWDASQNSCENDENGYLAEIYSEGENRFLEYIGQQISSLTSGVWIGLRWHNSWDDFYWVNSSVVYTYDNKLASCNSGYSYKYCIIFDQSNGKWCQQNCTTYSNYICEKAAEDDPCFPNPCQNGGTCSVNGNDYTCNCQAGFTGKSCETSGYCQPGWAHYGRNCFKFSGSVKSWEAAKSACETEANGYLAEIYNAEENNLLETTGKENSTLSSGVWIGLRWHSGWDDFYWMNSSVVYTYDGMLASCNTGYAYKYCIIFNQSNGNWCQQNCTTNSNYICEKQVSDNPCTQMPCKNGGTCTQQSNGYTCTCTSQYIGTNCEKTFCPMAWSYLDGKCYLYTDDTVSWSSARNVCLSSGGDLARIDNAVQNKFLYNLRSNAHNPAWIGLNDIETENVFKWAGTQRTASYTNWSPHEPNNGLWYGEEDCIEMTNTEKWNDNFCHLYRGFFCERSNLIA